ncbi:glucose-6-phosphate dehydrogenase [Holzapfeliella sp. He02]|uniref:Glucose-6-phosphate 1-dehydrogenase n=1 Tax=Holzapfeliella saturejae TaxID=3082953 RepID=A0ABU8SFM1_9LACO
MKKNLPVLFVIFGGSGDLAHRKLYPALFNLFRKGALQENFAVVGTARRPWSDDYFQETVQQAIVENVNAVDRDLVDQFSRHFFYQSHDVTDENHYIELNNKIEQLESQFKTQGNRTFYLAMSPQFFGTISQHLKAQNLVTDTGYNRLVVEKPFGHDLESAKVLNQQIGDSFAEKDVYRIDHYLGKQMIQNIMYLRLTNPLFDSIWDSEHIQNVQVTLAESLGVENRGGYYETAGALRDMVQNHIFQIASQVAMKKPVSLTSTDIHQAKQEVLNSIQMYDADDVNRFFVRGQYAGNDSENSYREEEQVSPESTVETFVAGKLLFKAGPLQNVPFYIRTGKKLAQKTTRVDLVLKSSHDLFEQNQDNVISIEIDPENKLTVTLNGKQLSQTDLSSLQMKFAYTKDEVAQIPDAYEKLFYDFLIGDRTNFVHWHEVKTTWDFIDRIEKTWQEDAQPPFAYQNGSMGPNEVSRIFEGTTDSWVFKG